MTLCKYIYPKTIITAGYSSPDPVSPHSFRPGPPPSPPPPRDLHLPLIVPAAAPCMPSAFYHARGGGEARTRTHSGTHAHAHDIPPGISRIPRPGLTNRQGPPHAGLANKEAVPHPRAGRAQWGMQRGRLCLPCYVRRAGGQNSRGAGRIAGPG